MMKNFVNAHRCKGCGYCLDACPQNAITQSGQANKKGYLTVKVSQEKCIGCGICYLVCPDYVFEISKETTASARKTVVGSM